jgi:putative transposase
METISDRRTIQEIATGHCIHAIQVSQRKRQLLDGTSEIFTRGKKINAKKKTAALFQ